MKLEIKEYVSSDKVSRRIVENAYIQNDGLIHVYIDNTSDGEILEVINMRALTFIGLNVLDPW